MNKRKMIGAALGGSAVLIVLIIGAVFIFRNRFSETRDPKEAVLRAFAKTYGEIKAPDIQLTALFTEIMNGRWQQDVTLGLDKLSGDMLSLDPRVASALEVLTLKNSTRRDTDAQKLSDTLTLQLAVSTLADMHIYGDLDTLAFNIPQAFDYFVTVDPRHVAREWDTSLLGTYLFPIDGMILEDAFYEYYKRLLFAKAAPVAEVPDLTSQIGILTDGAAYIYEGQDNLAAGETAIPCEVYAVTLPEASVNAYWHQINPAKRFAGGFPDDLIGAYLTSFVEKLDSLYFENEITTRIYVSEGKVAGIELNARIWIAGEAWDGEGRIYLTGEIASLDKTDITLRIVNADQAWQLHTVSETRVSNPELSLSNVDMRVWNESDAEAEALNIAWQLRWDRSVKADDNFSLALKTDAAGRTWLDIAVSGALTADPVNKHLDANLKKMALKLDWPQGKLDAQLNMKYILRTDTEDITYNTNGAVPLTRVGELDLLDMYQRVASDPRLGMFFSGTLP